MLNWPENERSESTLHIDEFEQPVPSSGPMKFPVEPGEHTIAIKRRGHEQIDIRIAFEEGTYHHYSPEWRESPQAKIDMGDIRIHYGPEWREAAQAEIDMGKPPEAELAERKKPAEIDMGKPPEAEPVDGKPPEMGPAKRERMKKELPAHEIEKTPPKPKPQPPKDPEELLNSKGLRAHGDYLSLSEESQVNKEFWNAQKLWSEVLKAQREVEKVQKVVDEGNKVMLAYVHELGQLGALLNAARTVAENNRIVGAMNNLEARMVITRRQLDEAEKARDQARAAGIAESEEFAERLLEVRELYDGVKKRYEDLAADRAVTRAVEQYNETSSRTYRLGPGTLLTGIGGRLGALEAKVFSEAVPLRRGEGDQWFVSVMLNGKFAQEMVIDTGASVIVLSWETAQRVGLAPRMLPPGMPVRPGMPVVPGQRPTFPTPGPGVRTMQVQVADGRVLEVNQVVAKSVRVGKFTANNVECAVLPQGLPGTMPLLGMSFFNNFNFKIDQGKGQLIMSQIDTSDASGRNSE